VRRIGTWTAAAVLGAGLLAGCGGSDTEAYCSSLEDAQDSFSGDVDPANFGDLTDQVEEIVDEAPDDVKGDWEKLQGALDDFESALDDAGLSVDDLSDPEALADVDPEDAAKIQEVANSMGTDFEDASNNIEKHAKDECDIDLGES